MYEQIAKNKRRTFLLLFFFVALIAAAALAFNFLLGFGAIGVVVAIVFAIAMAWGSYFYSDRVALAASRAKPAEGPEYQRYHNLVEGLCIAAGLPKPRLYVVDDPAPNAFATGRNPKHAALAVAVAVTVLRAAFERRLDPHLGGGTGGVVHDGLVVLELLERRDQPGRVPSELDAARIGQQLPTPAHRELHEESDEGRQDQEGEGEDHEDDAEAAAVRRVATVPSAAEPHEAQA